MLEVITLFFTAAPVLYAWSNSKIPMKRLVGGEMRRNRTSLSEIIRRYDRGRDVDFEDVRHVVETLEYEDTESVLNGMGSLSRITNRKTIPEDFAVKRLRGKYLDEVLEKYVNYSIKMKNDIRRAEGSNADISRFMRRLKGRSEELAAAYYLMKK